MEMEREDGLLFICDVDDDINVTAFAPFGVDCLKEVIEVHKANRRTLTRVALLRLWVARESQSPNASAGSVIGRAGN
jgi:hypothetical protein